jgi:replicative DNA helicase
VRAKRDVDDDFNKQIMPDLRWDVKMDINKSQVEADQICVGAADNIISACLADPESAMVAVDELQVNCFPTKNHRTAFSAIEGLLKSGKPVDLISVVQGCLDSGEPIASWISSIEGVVPGPAFVRQWCGIVKDHADRKRTLAKLESVKRDLQNPAMPFDTICQYAVSVLQERRVATKDKWSMIERVNVESAFKVRPPAKKMILKGILPRGIVGCVAGTGGMSKTFLLLMAGIAVASCWSIPPFESGGGKLRVLIITPEDSLDELERRLYSIGEAYGLDEKTCHDVAGNLIILSGRGIIGPLMQLEGNKPVPTENAKWLKEQIDLHKPDLVILDPRSRLYGLDENNNDHAAQWISLLESMLLDHPDTTILFVSHTGKANTSNGDQHAARGASAFIDNSRAALIVIPPSPTDIDLLKADDPELYIKLVVGKMSYAAKAPPVFFRRNQFGVPVMVDIQGTKMEAMGTALDVVVDTLNGFDKGIRRRDLVRTTEKWLKDLKKEALEVSGLRPADWEKIINFGIESTRLEEILDGPADAKTTSRLIRNRCQPVPQSSNWTAKVVNQ